MVEFEYNIQEKRFEKVKEAYVSDDIDRHELDEVLDGILDCGAPYLTDFILCNSGTIRKPDGSFLFLNERVEVDGKLCRKV